MSFSPRLSARAWLVLPLVAVAFLMWINAGRIRHVRYVSGLGGESAAVDPDSPTGYAGGVRELIVPGSDAQSLQWIVQTQRMFAQSEWRVRHVDFDNAPYGREVSSASPFRWWLGLFGWIDHAISGRPIGLAVERASLFAGPALHLVLLGAAVFFTARYFGGIAAGLLGLGIAAAFPFSASFLPAQPDDFAVALGLALASVLPVIAATRTGDGAPESSAGRRGFLLAGVAGGLALWVDPTRELPVLAGIIAGGILAVLVSRRRESPGVEARAAPLPLHFWRTWAVAGASTCAVGFLIEFFPAHLSGPRLEAVHPLHAIAWLGAGELLARTTARMHRTHRARRRRDLVVLILAVLAVAALPTALLFESGQGLWSRDLLADRLSGLPEAESAHDTLDWLFRDGLSMTVLAAALPLLWLVPAGWLLARRSTPAPHRRALALALGPVLVAMGFAGFQLRWWSMLDAMLLALLVPLAAGITEGRPRSSKLARISWSVAVAAVLAPGLILLVIDQRKTSGDAVTQWEARALIQRDLAHWLARRAGAEAIILAPPNLTAALCFHGGIRGLSTPYWENKDGFLAAVRLAAAKSPDEAEALARRRELTHIVVPSWDDYLDQYARLGSDQPENSLIGLLHRWLPPRWLRPMAYVLPHIEGFEGDSVAVFKVVDVQDNALALSRLAEYFVEMRRLEDASRVAGTLAQYFPSDLAGLVAQAQVAAAQRDPTTFAAALEAMAPFLDRGEEAGLPWDRQVSLAIVLAQGDRLTPAREQVSRCLETIDENGLRSLSTVSLHRFQTLVRALGMEIADSHLRALARSLLPPEMRDER